MALSRALGAPPLPAGAASGGVAICAIAMGAEKQNSRHAAGAGQSGSCGKLPSGRGAWCRSRGRRLGAAIGQANLASLRALSTRPGLRMPPVSRACAPMPRAASGTAIQSPRPCRGFMPLPYPLSRDARDWSGGSVADRRRFRQCKVA